MDWQPIETASLDGTQVELFFPDLYPEFFWSIGSWDDDRYSKQPKPYWRLQVHYVGKTRVRNSPPTHWRPLTIPDEYHNSAQRFSRKVTSK